MVTIYYLLGFVLLAEYLNFIYIGLLSKFYIAYANYRNRKLKRINPEYVAPVLPIEGQFVADLVNDMVENPQKAVVEVKGYFEKLSFHIHMIGFIWMIAGVFSKFSYIFLCMILIRVVLFPMLATYLKKNSKTTTLLIVISIAQVILLSIILYQYFFKQFA